MLLLILRRIDRGKRLDTVYIWRDGAWGVSLAAIQDLAAWTQENLGGIGGHIKTLCQAVVLSLILWRDVFLHGKITDVHEDTITNALLPLGALEDFVVQADTGRAPIGAGEQEVHDFIFLLRLRQCGVEAT